MLQRRIQITSTLVDERRFLARNSTRAIHPLGLSNHRGMSSTRNEPHPGAACLVCRPSNSDAADGWS